MKFVTIIDARSQFIKAATVPRASATRDDVSEAIVHTGEHYDANISDIFFEELAIPWPGHYLGIGGGPHGAMTDRQIEAVLIDEKPDFLPVYDHTNSTNAGALATVKLHFPVVHVEAGLGSFNRRMPEEINRVLTDHARNLLFAPTETAMRNLSQEGIPSERTHLVGDVMYDAALFYGDRARKLDWFDTLPVQVGEFVLATVHRVENTGDPQRLTDIRSGLSASGKQVILPLHPKTGQSIQSLDLPVLRNVHIIPPVGYLEMVWLEKNCDLIATDSGGAQKEAYFHGKPYVTLRDETECVELAEAGWNILTRSNPDRIASALASYTPPQMNPFYGAGDTAAKVLDWIAT